MIFERVRGLALGGVVPLTALTFRDAGQAQGWTKRLNAAIVRVEQRGAGPVNQEHLVWLLGLAVSRLT